MKVVKGIIIVTILAVIIENLGFLYIEKVYLSANNSYDIKKIENKIGNEKLEINIDKKSENIKSSYDGKYISYMLDNKLVICSTLDESKNIYKEEAGELVYYKWLDDRNIMILMEKVVEDGEVFFLPISYDAKNGQVNPVTNHDMKLVKIKSDNVFCNIDLISFSTATHSLYIKISDENNISNLYYINVMNEVEKVKNNENIGNVVVPTTNSNAIMEVGKDIVHLNNKENIKVPNADNPKILGTDKNNKVYFCNDTNRKTSVIYYTDLREDNYKWSKLNLKEEVLIDDIYVDYSGRVYLKSEDKNLIKELKSNKEIKYEGNFIQSYCEGVITENNGKIIKKKIE